MLLLISGIIIGILLSILAIIAGKRLDNTINKPYQSNKKATIISLNNPIDKILNE